MIMMERSLPAEVTRQYLAFALLEDIVEKIKAKRLAQNEPTPSKPTRDERSFYAARSRLAAMLAEMMSDDDVCCVNAVMRAAGIDHLTQSAVRFYFDSEPVRPGWWQIHLFYGGRGSPMGRGHGHVIAHVNAKGTHVSIVNHIVPGPRRTHAV